MSRSFNIWEVVVAALVLLFGAYVAWQGSTYEVGTATQMGAGYAPVGLGLILIGLGAVLMWTSRGSSLLPDLQMKPFICVMLSLLSFALLVEWAGAIPATFCMVVIALFAHRPFNLLATLLLAVCVSVIGYLVFGIGLGIPLVAFRI